MANIDLDRLNNSGNNSRKFEKVKDNEVSTIGRIIQEAMARLGGSNNEMFEEKDVEKLLSDVQSKLEHTYLDLVDAQDMCTNIIKLKKCDSNEHTSLKDLNIALLLTHEDYLAPIFYHRAMALFAWGKYKEAAVDFEQALVFKFKGKDLYKLYHKLAQCYQKIKKFSRSVECMKNAVENIKTAKINDKQKKEYVRILKESIEKIANKKDAVVNKSMKSMIKVKDPHTTDPRLSKLIRIEVSPEKGRYAVAREDIPVGTILMKDEGMYPFLNPDDKDNVMKFCLVCMKNVGSLPYPCLTCARVVYCSPTCREMGAKQFHSCQCQLDIYNIRQKDTKDWCRIFSSLNIILAKPLDFWISNQERFLGENKSIIDSEGLPLSVENEIDRYNQLFDMVTHEDDIPLETRAKHAVVVVFHLRSLRMTNYYSKNNIKIKTKEFTREEIILGKLILKLRLISEANLYPVWGVEDEDGGQVGIESIGSGIYPGIGSYLNSSCNPNTIRVNKGQEVVVVAAKNIDKDEEITDNCCIHYSELPTQERREWLRETFQFSCSCTACLQNWPVFDQLQADVPTEVQQLLRPVEKENAEALRFAIYIQKSFVPTFDLYF